MAKQAMTVIFVHGWSVTNTDTYGGLPVRLRNEAQSRNLALDVRHIYLGRYLSFHDEVTLRDVARAFESALNSLHPPEKTSSIACITHSTGGPVIREWWQRFYQRRGRTCPMSHLIMLAPANHGSALAQLGKGRLGRIKAAFSGVEPGQGILDWLELGSPEACALNKDWIENGANALRKGGMFPFVLTGQTIDRKLYDHLNAYTGESGSDGVVRVAAANLNGAAITLDQKKIAKSGRKNTFAALELSRVANAPPTAMQVIGGASHSGSDLGIMRSVYRPAGHARGKAVTDAIFDCLSVTDKRDYDQVTTRFDNITKRVQDAERLEVEKKLLRRDVSFIHDRYSMVIFRVFDDHDNPVSDFDLILTAGADNNPNHLPRGFFRDRQQNKRANNTVTYYFNYDVMAGAPALINADGRPVRPQLAGAKALGIRVLPRPDRGFVRYQACQFRADAEMLRHALTANATTIIDLRLRRLVDKNVFRVSRLKGEDVERNFKRTKPDGTFIDD
ncbi:MAG: phospholipase [Pseudomonadota bacterium]